MASNIWVIWLTTGLCDDIYFGWQLRTFQLSIRILHFRNDRYSIFKNFARVKILNMDKIENKYLVIPTHKKCQMRKI